MEFKIFTVYDMKAEFFGQPFFEQEEASAIRSFGDAVNDGSNPANQWFKHPEDFQLYLIGSFDNERGELKTCLPKALVMASALARRKSPDDLPLFEKNGEKVPVVS